ncbi:rRNA pseudouridine synthase [Limisphaera ngatamarikiensis]|uniref:Pseudouridine synthase n=1 Tax=Limisphaera ngatamarikiensis TaxID=1324935 RepID=A0A6M1RSH0_9BACT|nr:pseudouridine synthase [Limisphaera ngatamarikiensis]NGO40337.1 rRNA pseudouridine synthase [Limisphaera ngatamarikiensis]
MQVRLQKFLAEAGVASRRAAEELILAGRVCVNGQPVTRLGSRVDPDRDEVTVDGQVVRPRRKLYVALHKPPGYVCTRNDPQGRPVVHDLLPPEWRNLFTVGRLDRQSEGLLFLTNDGEFALRLTHPRYGVKKTYEVTVTGRIEPAALQPLLQGVRHRGELLRATAARLLRASRKRSIIELELAEGKNREVRRMCASQGWQVERLVRTRIGRIRLGDLPPGRWRTLTASEIKTLLAPL